MPKKHITLLTPFRMAADPDAMVEVMLDEPCHRCSKSGMVQNSVWENYYNTPGIAAKMKDPNYEIPAHILAQPEEVVCGECDGAGFKPTPFGSAILQLVNRYK